ncbi:MAG: acetylxylan esterase [Lentisphaeria bacterium]|nr:acetylxylan esterase [Lentisphaeria bacterium]
MPEHIQTRQCLAPRLEWFDQWMERTGEKVPDFDALPSCPQLPDLLTNVAGEPVRDATAWQARQAELLALVQRYLTGTWPATPPKLTSTRILAEAPMGQAHWRHVQLIFGAQGELSFDIEVMTPTGTGPFPVFITQSNHRRWATLAVSRGYIACVYPGADANDQSDQLSALYPDCDWSKLTRRAWLGCRALDYLLELPLVDNRHVAITGHSRNGKQSLIAAAMDGRISAVISSSSGSGGVVPWRCSSEFCFQESVEFMTRQPTTQDWFHPRLRFFTGREDRLPIDTHAILALIAPRACLISDAATDGCASLFGVEASYLAVREVYKLLQAEDQLSVLWRWGNHETCAETIHRYLDWTDTLFRQASHSFPEKLHFQFDFRFWMSNQSDEDVQPPPSQAGARARVGWLLGHAPPQIIDTGGTYGKRMPHRLAMLGQASVPDGVERFPISFSDYVKAEVFAPLDRGDAPLPAIIWLHPFSHSFGNAGAYMGGCQVQHELARNGYLVFTFSQLGCGSRVEEGQSFYTRYPRWSKLGRMVRDVMAALDVLTRSSQPWAAGTGAEDCQLPAVDMSRIGLVGYSLGGLVALFAAALDPRVSHVASFCGAVPFPEHPLHADRQAMQPFWQLPALLPRLVPFAHETDTCPAGLEDVLSLVSPRPALLVSPLHDREIHARSVAKAVQKAQYENLDFRMPGDYNRFQSDQHQMLLEWLADVGASE